MYKATAAQQGGSDQGDGDASAEASEGKTDDGVEDADYEVVD
jgi:hypothetical protein